jgi:hypothetical protein
VDQIVAEGGQARAFGVDAREEADMIALVDRIEAEVGPLEVVVFNIGANVPFPIVETTARAYTKMWEMAALSGFITGREAARVMIPRRRGAILFTGATASVRGRARLSAFSGAKHARFGPEHGSRARSQGDPRGAHNLRRGNRRNLQSRAPDRRGGPTGRRCHHEARRDRSQLRVVAQPGPLSLDLRAGPSAVVRALVTADEDENGGSDLRPIDRDQPDQFHRGFLPVELFEALKAAVLQPQQARRLGNMDRNGWRSRCGNPPHLSARPIELWRSLQAQIQGKRPVTVISNSDSSGQKIGRSYLENRSK